MYSDIRLPLILSKTGRLVVCGGALKFSLSDRGLWDTSVSHCLLCLVFTPLRRVYTAAVVAAAVALSPLASSKTHETYRENRQGRGNGGSDKDARRVVGKRDKEDERR